MYYEERISPVLDYGFINSTTTTNTTNQSQASHSTTSGSGKSLPSFINGLGSSYPYTNTNTNGSSSSFIIQKSNQTHQFHNGAKSDLNICGTNSSSKLTSSSTTTSNGAYNCSLSDNDGTVSSSKTFINTSGKKKKNKKQMGNGKSCVQNGQSVESGISEHKFGIPGDPGYDVECKVVLVGDSTCGKTALIERFVCDTFNEVYTPTNFDKMNTTAQIGEIRVAFNIWDTSGSSSHDSIRPLAFSDAKVFIVCFDIGNPASLDHVVTKWYREIREHCEKCPIILCGCRSDLRNNVECLSQLAQLKQIPVTSEQALQVSRYIQATTYVETSALVDRYIRETFEFASLAAFGKLNGFLSNKKSPFKSTKKSSENIYSSNSQNHLLKSKDINAYNTDSTVAAGSGGKIIKSHQQKCSIV